MADRGAEIIFWVFLERKSRVGNPGSLEGISDFDAEIDSEMVTYSVPSIHFLSVVYPIFARWCYWWNTVFCRFYKNPLYYPSLHRPILQNQFQLHIDCHWHFYREVGCTSSQYPLYSVDGYLYSHYLSTKHQCCKQELNTTIVSFN